MKPSTLHLHDPVRTNRAVLDFEIMLVKDFSLSLNTKGFCHVVDITSQVQEKILESGAKKGVVTIFVVGSTGGITTVEYEPGLVNVVE